MWRSHGPWHSLLWNSRRVTARRPSRPDSKADITDLFAFVSYDNPGKVTLILDVDPLLEPSNGPNYFPFDPNILYSIRIDNTHDAVEDIVFEFRFQTEIRAPGLFTGFAGAGDGIPAGPDSAPPIAPGTPLIPPAIKALDGPGSEGFSLRQTYTVTMVKNGVRTQLTNASGGNLFAVPTKTWARARCPCTPVSRSRAFMISAMACAYGLEPRMIRSSLMSARSSIPPELSSGVWWWSAERGAGRKRSLQCRVRQPLRIQREHHCSGSSNRDADSDGNPGSGHGSRGDGRRLGDHSSARDDGSPFARYASDLR